MATKIAFGKAKAVLLEKGQIFMGRSDSEKYMPSENAALEADAEQARTVLMGPPEPGVMRTDRFRAPHETTDVAGLAGSKKRPGEVALAHGGLLVLSPVENFKRYAVEPVAEAWRSKKDGFGRPTRFAVLLGVSPESMKSEIGRERVQKALALFGIDKMPVVESVGRSEDVGSMRGLLRQLEEGGEAIAFGWYKPAEVYKALVDAYLKVHSLKADFDRMEEIPQSLMPAYNAVMKAADAIMQAQKASNGLSDQMKAAYKKFQR